MPYTLISGRPSEDEMAGLSSEIRQLDFSATDDHWLTVLPQSSEKTAASLSPDILRFGRSSALEPCRVIIQTCNSERVQEFKMLGLIVGSTPTAQAIGRLGAYLRALLEETTHGCISENWAQKIEIVQRAQLELIALEEKERTLMPGDFGGQEALREALILIIDRGIRDNNKISASLTQTSGRLYNVLMETRNFIEQDYQFPDIPFSPKDQLHFCQSPGQYFIYDSADHPSLPGDEALQALEGFYARLIDTPESNTTPQQPILEQTNNVFKRHGYFNPKNRHDDQKILQQLSLKKRSFLKRLGYNLKHLPLSLLKSLREGAQQVTMLLTYEWQGAQHIPYMNPPPSRINKPESEHVIPPRRTTFSTPQTALPTIPQEKSIALRPPHSMRLNSAHDNLLSQIMGGLTKKIQGFENRALANPASTLAITALTALTFGAMALPKMTTALLKELGIKNAATVVQNINTITGADQLSLLMKVLKSVSLADLQDKFLKILYEHANQQLWLQWRELLENPLECLCLLGEVSALSLAMELDLASPHLLTGSQAMRSLEKIDQINTITNNIKYIDDLDRGSQKLPLNFFASILAFPLQFIAPPLRLLLTPFLAAKACWQAQSLRPLGAKWGYEGLHLIHALGKAALAIGDMISKTLKTAYGALTLYPVVIFKTLFKIIYRPVATVGKACEALGLKKAGKILQNLSNTFIEFQYQIEYFFGRINRAIIRSVFQWPNYKIHEWFDPTHPGKRLSRFADQFKELALCYHRADRLYPGTGYEESEKALKTLAQKLKEQANTYHHNQTFSQMKAQLTQALEEYASTYQELPQQSIDPRYQARIQSLLTQVETLAQPELETKPIHSSSEKQAAEDFSKGFEKACRELQGRLKAATQAPDPHPQKRSTQKLQN